MNCFRWDLAGVLTFSLLLVIGRLAAQTDVDVQQAFRDLAQDGVLMDVSAHPDDEDGATLAYYRMKYGFKTYSVLFTRGEGGQNEKGPELYEDLGVLRSAETEEAGKILDTEVHFLNFLDFGFSKTATEAFHKWGGERETLRRLVFTIRRLKPDVIFTNHNTVDGHGHHQAAAITTLAAFDVAADSSFFPEQLKEPGITLWQPRKLFFRSFGRYEPVADVANNIEEIDPLRKTTYLDIATEALRMHKTQGMERANLRAFTRGKSLYRLMRANSLYDADSTSFFSGIDLWSDPSLAGLLPLRRELSRWHPTMQRDSLLEGGSRILMLLDSLDAQGVGSPAAKRMLTHWRQDIGRVISVACGLRISVELQDRVLVARQKVEAVLEVSSDNCELRGARVQFDLPAGWVMNERPDAAPEMDGHHYKRYYDLQAGETPIATVPQSQAQYRPIETHQEIIARVHVSLNGRPFIQEAAAKFDVAPYEQLTVSPKVAWEQPGRDGERGISFSYVVKNYLPHKTAGKIRVEGPAGWRTDRASYAIPAEDSSATGTLVVHPPANAQEGEYALRFRTDYGSEEVTARVFKVNLADRSTVGVIKSYDNTIESALHDLGVGHSLLSDAEISSGDIAKYGTIVVDIRAYLVRDALKKNNDRLLEYVKNGGNLIVMYQREQEWKPEYAPLPFQISRRRVTVEEAPITILQPAHPLLTLPNRITNDDWSGWKQERGVYFPSDVPPGYSKLLSCNDPDEAPLTTGYLVAREGKGSYIYTSYVWYRQLKEANAGAFRCFANMISYPKYRE